MRRASIDLGTNTCLLLISQWDPVARAVSRIVSDHSTIVRLGEGVDQARALKAEAIDRTLACLRRYAEITREAGLNPADAICVATSQARDARNGQEFFARVQAETGFRFVILSGEDEAKYTFLGALAPGISPADSAVIDIGGGSTEYITESGGLSIDMGSVRFTERYLRADPVTDPEFWACQEAIDHALAPAIDWRRKNPQLKTLVAVAGTATTLAAWQLELARFDAAALDQAVLTRGDIHRMVEELKWRTIAERRELPGMEPKRADVLLAGALILWRSLELLNFPECRISTRGLRFGVLQIAQVAT